jgi:hypothetical protein
MNGLVLTLGGAPETWHTVEGLPGYFHPRIAVPVGEPGFTPEDAAQAASKAPGTPVKLVKVKDCDEGRAAVLELRGKVLKALDRAKDVAPLEQVAAEIEAVGLNDDKRG